VRSAREALAALASLSAAAFLITTGAFLVRESPGSAAGSGAATRTETLPVADVAPATTTTSPAPQATAPPASAPPTTAPPLTTAAPPAPEAPLELPQPHPVPKEPYAHVPVIAIGEIEIPKIGLATPVYEGVWRTVIDVGPGHWPGTAEPGGWGNSVYGGHRSTYTEPFRHIDQLVPGDRIVVRTPVDTFTYAVTGSEIVDDSALWIVDQAPGRTITLFACHPVGSTAQRYVVRGSLVT
jgi:sortase A